MLGENNQKKYSVGVQRALKQIRDQPFSHRKLDIQKIKRSLM